MEPMRCGHCGDVIGVYEPLILVREGQARITSAAAEPHIYEEPGERFHSACHSDEPTDGSLASWG